MSTWLIIDLMVTVVFFLVVLAVVFVYSSVFWSIFRDAPFVPSPRKVADAMMNLADVREGEMVVDLGSGHGELLMAAARRGGRGVGYELSRFLGFVTRMRARLFARQATVVVHRRDFFGADLSGADVVSCYLFPKSMERLREKFEGALRPGARVVSASFAIPGWTPVKTVRVANRPIYLYVMP